MKETTFYCDKEIIVIIILLWKVWYKGCGTAPCIKKIPLFVQCLSVPMLFWLVMASPSHLSAPTFCLPSLLKAKNGGKSLLYLINKQPGIIIQLIINNDDSKNAWKHPSMREKVFMPIIIWFYGIIILDEFSYKRTLMLIIYFRARRNVC